LWFFANIVDARRALLFTVGYLVANTDRKIFIKNAIGDTE
jgi:hypothetical protein